MPIVKRMNNGKGYPVPPVPAFRALLNAVNKSCVAIVQCLPAVKIFMENCMGTFFPGAENKHIEFRICIFFPDRAISWLQEGNK